MSDAIQLESELRTDNSAPETHEFESRQMYRDATAEVHDPVSTTLEINVQF